MSTVHPFSDAPAGHGFGFVLWPGTASAAGPIIPGPWHPPVDYTCNCITPDNPDLPPVAPAPVPASAGLLIAAVAAFAIIRRRA